MDQLLEHLAGWKPFRAVVVGDFMVDEMVYGDAERLSADAPVPVLHVRRVERTPGGAANLSLGLRALGGEVAAVGVVGDDEPGRFLGAHLAEQGIDCAGLATDSGDRPTTVKRNLIGLAQQRHPQKMFRVDYESREPIGASTRDALIDALRAAVERADVVCIEDYDKGVCSNELCAAVVEIARGAGVPVLVDPAKIGDYSRYRGCAAITPNRNEAEHATGIAGGGESHGAALAAELASLIGCEAVVLTLDRQGALLLERGSEPAEVPTVARQVYDVTGAGDIFLAGLAAGRANGLAWIDAVRLANVAAGLEVEQFGAQPVPIDRVHQQVLAESSGETGKLRSLEQLLVEVKAWRRDGRRIVFTNGCFDVLHAGHVSLLDRAAANGDVLIVAINDDATVRRLKGEGRPVNSQTDRARVLSGLGCVDRVIVFTEPTPAEVIEAIGPDVLVKGDEYSVEQIPGAAFVLERGGEVVRLSMVEGRSTTATVERIRAGQSRDA